MKYRNPTLSIAFVLLFLTACSSAYNPLDDYEQLQPATILDVPEPAEEIAFDEDIVERGRYLTRLLGCGSCHTNGALVGLPVPGQYLAGSDTGIAYSNPLAVRNPGIVYPSNLTPDAQTGLGNWSVEEIVTMVQRGVDNHSTQTLPVMPWPSYANITADDAFAIAAYLKSLPPVSHRVPENVAPGQRAVAPFVHFGVYQSRQR